MPNVATALKQEIARIARKEIKGDIAQLRKHVLRQRSEIASLKRRLESAERQLRGGSRPAAPASAASEAGSADEGLRFRAAGLASHRKRLGLSAKEAGLLLGVSALTVYKWEAGTTKPRRSQMGRIAAFRKLGKRQADAILEQIAK